MLQFQLDINRRLEMLRWGLSFFLISLSILAADDPTAKWPKPAKLYCSLLRGVGPVLRFLLTISPSAVDFEDLLNCLGRNSEEAAIESAMEYFNRARPLDEFEADSIMDFFKYMKAAPPKDFLPKLRKLA